MNRQIEELRKIYESTEIPAELSEVVSKALSGKAFTETKSNEKGVINMSEQAARKKNKVLYRTIGGVAAALAIFVSAFGIGVSSNEAFASSMQNVPLLGSLVQVFTGESVNQTDDICKIEMALPKVEGLSDKAVEDRINTEIEQKMKAVVEETKKQVAEDKKAYLETGGTEKEYKERIPEIIVNYRVNTISDEYLSFIIEKTQTSASAYFEQYYYNIDLKTNRDVTLKDLLGENYIKLANEQITAQIKERAKDPDAVYWGFSDSSDIDMSEEAFKTIAADQSFYVNKAGNPVIVFNKYEIAPGYMGIQEFEITK